MSKPNLPPVPKRIYAMSGIWNHAELDEAIQAYAEEAVRQALAELVPVAWVIDARKGVSDPQFCWGNPAGIYKSLYVPLAIIPDDSPGHKPAPVDTSLGHSAPVAGEAVSSIRVFVKDGKASRPASYGPRLSDGFHTFHAAPQASDKET